MVDHNNLKNFTLDKAKKLGIKTMKFPIEKNIKLNSRTILAVNHCVEILLRLRDGKTWRKSLEETIPKRKWQSIDGKEEEDKPKSQ